MHNLIIMYEYAHRKLGKKLLQGVLAILHFSRDPRWLALLNLTEKRSLQLFGICVRIPTNMVWHID